MEQNKLKELTDEQLVKEAKKLKTTHIIDATLIGVLLGILIYSVTKGNFSFFLGFILLYGVYKIATKKKYKKEDIEQLLKERHLK